MITAKIAISIDKETLKRLDHLVKNRVFPSRSKAMQEAIEDKLNRLQHTRLAEECAKLDPADEQALAEEGMSFELEQRPEY
ncbi:ribbon-helix-helix protein, CopG family [bacterium]|nr:ribbon-helix-helix protein, CopG family [bacterium]